MLANIIKYYEKITDLALISLKKEKRFAFKSKLNNKILMLQSTEHLKDVYKRAGGGTKLNKEAQKSLDDYVKAMQNIHKQSTKQYNKILASLKNKSDEEKQKILLDVAERGIAGFKGKNGMWNIETYSNMYFTHLNNEMVRFGQLEYIKTNELQIKISSHSTRCDVCKNYEGKIMSIGELENAKSNGLFHPRCQHFVIGI
jgi:hypothetical protein